MKLSREEKMARRFYILNMTVSIALLIVIVGSVFRFGEETVEGKHVVGLVLPGSVSGSGWNKSQYDGLKRATQSLDYDLFVIENTANDLNSLQTAADTLSKRRVKTVFFANTENLSDIAEVAEAHNNISFYGIETEKDDTNINKYNIRYIEAYYLAGIVAGIKTTTNKVGFIAPHPGFNINQMINAFTLGAHKIKKDIVVYLSWTGDFNAPAFEEQAVRDMRANNADVIAYFSESSTISDAAARARIDFISVFNSNSSMHNLATIKVDWENIYREIFKREKHGRKGVYTASIMDRNINVILNQPLDARGLAIFEAEAFEIKENKNVFTGPITDNKGYARAKANEVISNKTLDTMGYLVEGVKVLGN